jgi:hypothetical protein
MLVPLCGRLNESIAAQQSAFLRSLNATRAASTWLFGTDAFRTAALEKRWTSTTFATRLHIPRIALSRLCLGYHSCRIHSSRSREDRTRSVHRRLDSASSGAAQQVSIWMLRPSVHPMAHLQRLVQLIETTMTPAAARFAAGRPLGGGGCREHFKRDSEDFVPCWKHMVG